MTIEELKKKYGTGAIPDKEDPRDYIFSPVGAVGLSYPESFQLEKTTVKDQGNVNSCVAHSISTIKEIQEFYETKNKLSFSVGWIYGFRVDNQYKGEGMYPREALNNLIKYGDVLKTDFPENVEWSPVLTSLINRRRASCLAKAKNYKCKAYARVTNANDVKACLYAKHSPVMIICNIHDSFWGTKSDGIVSNDIKGTKPEFSHAMTIVGWKKIGNANYWIVQNSWGTGWADKGYCYIRQGSVIITDLYTITDMKNIR